MPIPKGKNALKKNASINIVKVSKCCDLQGFTYTKHGWHYLCATLKEYLNNPGIKYNQSILNKYYQSFQPKSLFESLFYGIDGHYSAMNRNVKMPWGTSVKFDENTQHFGPNSDQFIKEEFLRTINVYKKIAANGYRPDKYPDGYIRGHFLKNKNDYRFLLSAGQHRMAAIGVLGYKTIKVKLEPKWENVIDIENIQSFPQVRNGNCCFNQQCNRSFTDFFHSSKHLDKCC